MPSQTSLINFLFRSSDFAFSSCLADRFSLPIVTLILFLRDGVWAVILPSLTVLSLGLAVYLIMLGIITENALRQRRGRYAAIMPMAAEVGSHRPEEN